MTGGDEQSTTIAPEVVEICDLCGRLPLAVALAGGVVGNYGAVDQEVVELIREDLSGGFASGADGGGADSGLSVAERILVSSLRSLGAEERGPVERTFLLLAVFPEVSTIPMAVLDALAGLDEEEGGEEGEKE